MLEKPAIQDEKIVACLLKDYGLSAVHITFLPLGRDINTAVYHIQTPTPNQPYLFKLRSGPFNPAAVALPKLLQEQGIAQVIAPLPTTDGRLHAPLNDYNTILYPYIEGKNSYEVGLSDEQWVEFGTAVRRIHTADLPPTLTSTIRQESYSPQWRQAVKGFLTRIETETFTDPIAAELAAFLKDKRSETLALIGRAEQLSQTVQAQSLEHIACHADLHAGNVHITAGGTFYIIDWDTLIMAPKERDLMHIGGDLMGSWRTPQEEETLFYKGYFGGGYGRTAVSHDALSYYRCERILEDIAIECQQIISVEGIVEDREQSLYYLKSNYQPGSTIELAFQKPDFS